MRAAAAAEESSLKTLNLQLDEVAHIRSVLTKAQLESLPLDGEVREGVERGKVCFVCMTAKFGIFSRGQKCQMCKQMVCGRCCSKVRDIVCHVSSSGVLFMGTLCI